MNKYVFDVCESLCSRVEIEAETEEEARERCEQMYIEGEIDPDIFCGLERIDLVETCENTI